MTHNIWFCSDHHFGHRNILTFTDDENELIRPFSSIQEHDETIIHVHNSLVKQNDRVYFLGDVAIPRSGLKCVDKMNGRKVLIKGNHDIYKLKEYVDIFQDIRAYKVMPKEGLIASHIPLHPDSLSRFKVNVHGHTHINNLPDKRYINVCMEVCNYRPINLDQIMEYINANL